MIRKPDVVKTTTLKSSDLYGITDRFAACISSSSGVFVTVNILLATTQLVTVFFFELLLADAIKGRVSRVVFCRKRTIPRTQRYMQEVAKGTSTESLFTKPNLKLSSSSAVSTYSRTTPPSFDGYWFALCRRGTLRLEMRFHHNSGTIDIHVRLKLRLCLKEKELRRLYYG